VSRGNERTAGKSAGLETDEKGEEEITDEKHRCAAECGLAQWLVQPATKGVGLHLRSRKKELEKREIEST